MDAFLFQDPDVTLEIWNHGRKGVNRDVECRDILYDAVLLVRELLPGQHHVIQGYGKLTGDSIGSFLPLPGLQVKVVSPTAKHLGMVAD